MDMGDWNVKVNIEIGIPKIKGSDEYNPNF